MLNCADFETIFQQNCAVAVPNFRLFGTDKIISNILADNDRKPKLTDNQKKVKILGRKWEKAKVQTLLSQVIGLPCNCKRLPCFEVTTDIEQNALIAHFNSLKSKDQQDSMIRTSISKTGKL